MLSMFFFGMFVVFSELLVESVRVSAQSGAKFSNRPTRAARDK